jgi:hypothetical protein
MVGSIAQPGDTRAILEMDRAWLRVPGGCPQATAWCRKQ